ncbi:NAD(P)H-binding protein [Treponema sp.]
MRIAVFGASGRTGLPLIEAALKSGHEIIAFARSPEKLPQSRPGLTSIQIDLSDPQAEKLLLSQNFKADVIISSLGPDPKAKVGIMERSAALIKAYAKKEGIKRLIWMTGAGVKLEGDRPSCMRSLVRTLMKLVAPLALSDSETAVNIIIASDLDYTIARAPMLNDKGPSGRLQANDIPPKPAALSRIEIADFLLDCAISDKFMKKAPFLSLGDKN